ncbi:uncharacterized protein LOC133904542 [Phragmites australis]|uniref:uncharacterized protein LOC133904542 n=1 Tax=Phragmites australis TaxID=29695 RepID=UPI002D790E1F|nr:uncharacterized protein LOC133904542 [Phragmites australis]
MGIERSELKKGVEPFHGITPNSSMMPLGQIELSVTFRTSDNFCIEKLTFDFMDFETAYNVILGHPMLGKFMVVVHYAYQTLKIMSPKGVITVKGDQRTTVKCRVQVPQDAGHSRLVSLTSTSQSDDAVKEETNDGAKDKRTDGGVKAVPLDPSEPAKMVKVGAGLDPNRNSSSLLSSG